LIIEKIKNKKAKKIKIRYYLNVWIIFIGVSKIYGYYKGIYQIIYKNIDTSS
jgi:hypothetical protein